MPKRLIVELISMALSLALWLGWAWLIAEIWPINFEKQPLNVFLVICLGAGLLRGPAKIHQTVLSLAYPENRSA